MERNCLQRLIKSSFIMAGVMFCLTLPAFGAHPLTKDEIDLLLTAGATPQKIMTLVAARGVAFMMTPAIAKEFQKRGATPALIKEIQKISNQLYSVAPPPPPTLTSPPPLARSALPPAGQSPSKPASSAPQGAEAQSPRSSQLAGAHQKRTAAAPPAPPPPRKLSNPSPAEIQKIIQTFTAKEAMFKAARSDYTYHQINRVETLDPDGHVDGTWEQDWDILYDDNGHRIEKVTYAPVGDLKGVELTEQDLYQMRHTQPFVVTTRELPEYNIRYLGHVPLDKLTVYVFRVEPKVIKKHHEYFDGVVYVDDHDLQIVKTEGRQVPQIRRGSYENLFPSFTTWRQQIDGKFWFPVFTEANDTLYFSNGPVHIKEIIRYTDYKQFRSTSKIKMIGVAGPNTTPQPPSTTQHPSNQQDPH